MLAGLLLIRKKNHDALLKYKKILKTNPTFPHIHRYIGSCYKELKNYRTANHHFKKNLVIVPQDTETLKAQLELFNKWEKWKKSIPICQLILNKNPQDLEANFAYGLAYFHDQQHKEALPFFIETLKADEDHIQAYKHIATCLIEEKHIFEAKQVLLECLKKVPKEEDLLLTLSKLSLKQGEITDSYTFLKKAYQVNPSSKNKVLLSLFIPSFYTSTQNIKSWRKKFIEILETLKKKPPLLKNVATDIFPNNFYSVYQGFNEKELQLKTAKVFQTIMAPPEIKPNTPLKKRKDSRIHIGFLSGYFFRHSVSLFYANMIKHLPEDFHVSLFYVPHFKTDPITKQLIKRANAYYTPDATLEQCKKILSKSNLDLLIYPEIGMQALPYYLGLSQLAPVQAVLMGHPCTTGLPGIQHYISSDIFEHPTADDHYSESLIRIKGMPIDYNRPKTPKKWLSRFKLGLPENKTLYVCPMTLFKIHPSFDLAIQKILEQDPKGVVLLFKYNGMEKVLHQRFQKTCPNVVDRILFLNPFKFDQFIHVLGQSTVLLDTFPFSGGNTALLAFATGTPIVTLPTEFLRGRFCTGYYNYMGVTDCIASSRQNYAQIATKIGLNPEYRHHLSEQIISKRDKLFHNPEGSMHHYEVFRTLKKNS